MVKLSRINSILLVLIIAINTYIIAAPFAPNLWYWWQKNHSPQAAQLNDQIQKTDERSTQNKLIIPSMLLDQPVLEGRDTYAILNKGIWRWPGGSTPDRGGNTTLIGHRFTYTNPRGVFYFLDKVRVGDRLGVAWQGNLYRYKVHTAKIVPSSDTSILEPTKDSSLTLYTCTPLWSPKDRLVVVALLEEIL